MRLASDQIRNQHIAAQLIKILPRSEECANCIDPGIVPEFHYACHLLERLGYVEAKDQAMRLLDSPSAAQSNMRFDDACHILLLCLEKCRLINYNPLPRETVVALAESYDIFEDDLDPEIDDSGWDKIAGAEHSCDSTVHPSVASTLQNIGLVHEGQWTGHAIPILWRKWINKHPTERPADTYLFQDRLDTHFASIPKDVAEKLESAVSFSENLLLRKQELLAGQDDVEEEVRRLAGQARLLELEILFSTRWRFSDGWLSKEQQSRCMSFGFDALADEMANTIVCQKYPASDLAQTLKGAAHVRGHLH